jgi:acetyltransferase-like isoleucine patch superfamily enzyme
MFLKKSYYYNYIKYLLSGKNDNIMNDFYRTKGIIIGDNCHIYSNICTPEPYLINIADNVTIAPGAKLITHDNSVSKVIEGVTDVFGTITLEKNCFIGVNAIILPGVTIGCNSIIAAGAVVSKSIPAGVVAGGNPARIICSIKEYSNKISKYAINTEGLTPESKKQFLLNSEKLIIK